jgi:hypothetical protein
MFSAIAVMAFSVSSMANTIDSSDLLSLEDVFPQSEIVTSDFPCSDTFRSNVGILTNLGFNIDTARAIARAIFDNCLRELYG